MLKTCLVSSKSFEIKEAELQYYKKLGLIPPSLSPQERNRRRILFRNFRNLYHRNCNATGKKIISMYDVDSPFAYNESIAYEYMPLSKEDVLKRGMKWKDFDETALNEKGAKRLDHNIDRDEGVSLSSTFSCKDTGKSYRIIKPELDFYKRVHLPLPSVCPDARHIERMRLRGVRDVCSVQCKACKRALTAAANLARGGYVHCEPCYLEELYSAKEKR